MKPAEARTGAAAVGGADGDVVRLRPNSDRSGGAQSLVDGEQSFLVNGCDQMIVLCLQAHHVRLQIGDTPVEQTNLLEHARVSASKVP
ncbi:hypothetical protein [Kribbella voronezhensis]|uniref:hypothetical protein n=1 Tax=Kribbella voronezhensis TaxID=2512212 RepID=UPI00192DB057|nr:hypothetical protein [Kribbella voronezhensis]